MSVSPVRGIGSARLGLLGLALVIGGAQAPALAGEYEERHPFRLQFEVRPFDVYRGRWSWQLFASEYHAPPVCDPPPDARSQTGVYQPVGASAGQVTTLPLACAPDAQANAAFSLALDAGGHPFGSVDVFGHATLQGGGPPIQRARARSYSSLSVQTGAVRPGGRINWRPTWFTAAVARGSSARSNDPIDVSALNMDNLELLESRLWDSQILVEGGTSTWQDGRITIDAERGEFMVTMESPYLLSPRGAMRLLFEDGVVTASEDSGIFDGILPTIGSPSHGIDFLVGNPDGSFDLEFDFGGTSLTGWEMTADFSNEGETSEEIVPAPGTVLPLLTCLGIFATPRRGRARWQGSAPTRVGTW